MDTYQHDLDAIEIIPSSGGVFEVTLDGDLVFSKKTLGRHAQPGEILAALQGRI